MEDRNVIDPAITQFFTERKEAWLKKNIKADMEQWEVLEKEQECETNFKLANWLPDAAKRAGQISISSHPCTFSHPSARKNKNGYVSSIIEKCDNKADGFLRSGNLKVELDALGNAAALDVYKFLTLVMLDENSLLEHIQQETALARGLLAQVNCDYQALRSGFLKMVEPDEELITSSKIKQVYFPVDEGEYHLLSLLTHSGHLFEQRKRLDNLRFSEEVKAARACKKENKYHEQGYREIYGLTTIGFGGTKPQNISVLNNQNAGKAHLLASIPPTLSNRNIRLPKQEFFKEALNPWLSKPIFTAFHKILSTPYEKSILPNRNIRTARDNLVQAYVDHIIQVMWQVRLGLKDYKGNVPSELSPEQKIWLFTEHENKRFESDDWLLVIVRQISRSFILGYQKVITKSVSLADEELFAIESIVANNKEALR